MKKQSANNPSVSKKKYIEVPGIFQKIIGNLSVAADVMFVNGLPFVFSILRGVNFTTVEYFIQILKTALANSIGKIFKFYKITDIL